MDNGRTKQARRQGGSDRLWMEFVLWKEELDARLFASKCGRISALGEMHKRNNWQLPTSLTRKAIS